MHRLTGQIERYTTYSELLVVIMFTAVRKQLLDDNLLLEGRGQRWRTTFIMTVYFELTSLPSLLNIGKLLKSCGQ